MDLEQPVEGGVVDPATTGPTSAAGDDGGSVEERSLGLQESCSHLRDSLDHVVGLLGRLGLAWRVVETVVGGREEEGEGEGEGGRKKQSSWTIGDSLGTFLSDQVRFPHPGSRTVVIPFSRTAEQGIEYGLLSWSQ